MTHVSDATQQVACKLSIQEVISFPAVIVIAPETQHVLLNDNERAIFFCQAVGDIAYWSINDNTIDGLGNNELKGQGWIFSETFVADPHGQRNNIHNLTLQIPSVIGNNNTRIRCVAIQRSPAFSDTVLLIVKGIVLSPL